MYLTTLMLYERYITINQGRFMKKLLILIPILFISAKAVDGKNFEPSEYGCAGIDKHIKNINAKMRSGYSLSEGERLKEELRTLKDQRHACKKKRFSTN